MRILYIDIDSLRPDRLGCYGYGRDTSPTIDAVADDGVRFERCYTSDSPCLPSRTALATGRHGIKSGVVTHWGPGQWYEEPGEGHDPDPDRPLAFRYLAERGLYTASVSGFSNRHLAYHFGSGFRETVMPTPQTGAETADQVTGTAIEWLEDHATDDDWLLHVNYWDVHHAYKEVDGHVDAVRESGPAPDWPDGEALAAQEGMTGTRSRDLWPSPEQYRNEERGEGYGYRSGSFADWPFPESFEDREDVERLIDGYDAMIRKVDDSVSTLLERLEAAGVRDETAVIVTADHGEAFGEHGIYAEHAFPHPPCQRVPLILSWPGVTESGDRIVDEHVYQFDLVAALVDLFGEPVPAGWDAESLAPALRGEQFDGRDFLVCSHGIMSYGRAVYEDDWAFVRLVHPGVFSHPELYNDPENGYGLELLHNLEEDPHMTVNLVDRQPEVAARLRARLDGWVADQLSTRDAAGTDPLVRTADERGPFLYVDPEELADFYREHGRSDRQIEIVDHARDWPQ